MSQIKQGKRPLSQRQNYTGNLFRAANLLEIPEPIKKQLEEQGLEPRFISYKEYTSNGNHHVNHWSPFKINYGKVNGSSMELLPGQDVSNYLRRGDLILAARPKEMGEDHRAELQRRHSRYSKEALKADKEALKQAARAAGTSIDESDDEDSGN